MEEQPTERSYRGPLAEPLPDNQPKTTALAWRLERIGWALLGLLVVVAFAGALGAGPISWDRASSPGGEVVLDYQRLPHHNADDSVRLELAPSTVEDGKIPVEVRGSWASAVNFQGIVPEPSAQRTLPGGVLLEFEAEEFGVTSVTLYYRAYEYGPLDGEVSVGDNRLTFHQWVLP